MYAFLLFDYFMQAYFIKAVVKCTSVGSTTFLKQSSTLTG